MGAVADGASLLWRCRLHDTVAGDPAEDQGWRAIAEVAEQAFPDRARPGPPGDVHRAMALAALGDEVGLGNLLDGLQAAAIVAIRPPPQ